MSCYWRRACESHLLGSLEVSHSHLANALVSELTHGAGVGLLLDQGVLLLQGLLLNVLLVAVLHPLDAVDVSKECLPGLVIVTGKG